MNPDQVEKVAHAIGNTIALFFFVALLFLLMAGVGVVWLVLPAAIKPFTLVGTGVAVLLTLVMYLRRSFLRL